MKQYKGPRPKPVKKIDLPDHIRMRRIILAVVFLLLGVAAIGAGVNALISTESGWEEVEAASNQPNSGQDFVFNYYFGSSGMNPTEEERQVTALYTQAMEEGYVIFSRYVESETVGNVYYVNHNVNQEITVHPVLYEAFALLNRYENRCVFLAEVYNEYNRVFTAENETVAAGYDPMKNGDRDYVSQLAAFANDPQMIRVELLGNNRLKLVVAREYLAFAEENGIEEFLDFSWMTNAFIADYAAQLLSDGGFTKGYLASFDGFTRNLDSGSYQLNVFDRREDGVYMPARLGYQGPAALVSLRSYPMSDRDSWHYFSYSDGTVTTVCVDPADGMSKSSIHDLLSLSRDTGCAEVLMQMLPVYFADAFSEDALQGTTEKGVYSVWTVEGLTQTNDPALSLEALETNA